MSVDLAVMCACGKVLDLTNYKPVGASHTDVTIEVEPCPDCMETYKDEGDAAGYARGQEESDS